MHGPKDTYDGSTDQFDVGTKVVLPVCVQTEECTFNPLGPIAPIGAPVK